jgi:hypothetical protein
MGASLLVFLNKTDVEECMTEEEVREVSRRVESLDPIADLCLS